LPDVLDTAFSLCTYEIVNASMAYANRDPEGSEGQKRHGNGDSSGVIEREEIVETRRKSGSKNRIVK
jgi:hypothetical protein